MDSKVSINSGGETIFETPNGGDFSFNFDVVVIDEISMIAKAPMESILMSLKKKQMSGGDQTIQIFILMGDVGQLPPVTEDVSIIFDPQIQQRYAIKKLTLTKIMRSQNQLTQFSLDVRQLIPFEIDRYLKCDVTGINLTAYNPLEIKCHVDRQTWLDSYTQIFKEGRTTPSGSGYGGQSPPIIICYTNNDCDQLNRECRDRIFDHPEDFYVKGELLVFRGYYCIRRKKYIDETSSKEVSYYVKFFTSEPIIVEQLTPDTQEIVPFNYLTIIGKIESLSSNMLEWLSGKIPLRQQDYVLSEIKHLLNEWSLDPVNGKIHTNSGSDSLEMNLNHLSKMINKLNHTFHVVRLYVEGKHQKLDPLDTDPNQLYIVVIEESDKERYLTNCDKIKTMIRGSYLSLGRVCRGQGTLKLLIDYIFQKIWKVYYYRSYIWPFASIVYGYAITTHKAQGSTYTHTFVDVSNILGCSKVTAIVRSKSMYTDMTRASHSINILYHKYSLYPTLASELTFKCQLCQVSHPLKMYTSVNYTIDKTCADHLLEKIISTSIYQLGNIVIMADKHKNLYQIPIEELADVHINDAFEYVRQHGLQRSEIERYQYSNLVLCQTILTKIAFNPKDS